LSTGIAGTLTGTDRRIERFSVVVQSVQSPTAAKRDFLAVDAASFVYKRMGCYGIPTNPAQNAAASCKEALFSISRIVVLML
jgi:hypothetical protein